MAWKFKSGFAGEVFDKKRSRSPRLAEYLLIYVQHLAPERRTETNELLEFLENPNSGQIIVYFGLSYRGKPCGFATLMLYPDSGVGVVDHIAIAPTVRGYGAFFSFCEFIADYLETQKQIYNYLISEILLGEHAYVTGMSPLNSSPFDPVRGLSSRKYCVHRARSRDRNRPKITSRSPNDGLPAGSK